MFSHVNVKNRKIEAFVTKLCLLLNSFCYGHYTLHCNFAKCMKKKPLLSFLKLNSMRGVNSVRELMSMGGFWGESPPPLHCQSER